MRAIKKNTVTIYKWMRKGNYRLQGEELLVFAIIDNFKNRPRGISFTEIMHWSGIKRYKLRKILNHLIKKGFIEKC